VKDTENPNSKHDFSIDIIPTIIESQRLFAYPFRDPDTGQQAYWRDVGTVDAFWEAHMELLDPSPDLDLFDQEWPILTYQAQLPPAKMVVSDGEQPGMVNSMASGGCVISGAQVRPTSSATS
jgi:glucose-1-phosphate adenylyltransferase